MYGMYNIGLFYNFHAVQKRWKVSWYSNKKYHYTSMWSSNYPTIPLEYIHSNNSFKNENKNGVDDINDFGCTEDLYTQKWQILNITRYNFNFQLCRFVKILYFHAFIIQPLLWINETKVSIKLKNLYNLAIITSYTDQLNSIYDYVEMWLGDVTKNELFLHIMLCVKNLTNEVKLSIKTNIKYIY